MATAAPARDEEATPAITRNLEEALTRVRRAGDRPVRAAFLARALNALARLTPDLEEHVLGDAAGAPSDYAVLVRALGAPEAVAVLRRDDPLAPARVRGLHAKEQLLEAEGGTLTVDAVARLLGITRQAVDKRRRAGRLLALSMGRRGYAYPAWQFGPEGVLPGLEEVMAEFQVCGAWTKAGFFLGGNLYLDGESPLAELRRGNVAAVRRAASMYGEHGAP
jgi:hypothetical protein